jgi:phenylalanyl-tRNA synthetase alpha chain
MSSEWIGQLRSIEQQFDRERESVADLRSLEELKNRFLSRKSGLLTLQLQNVRSVPATERAEFGRIANEIKTKVESDIEALRSRIASMDANASLERERLDVTLPGNRRRLGHRHPLTIARQEIEDIFVAMGYTVETGRSREDLLQLRGAQYSGKPSGTRRQGHVLLSRRRRPSSRTPRPCRCEPWRR